MEKSRYLETIAGIGERRIRRKRVREEIELVVGAVVALAVEAVTAVTAAFHGGGGRLLLVVVFNEVLNHFVQTNGARLEFRRRRTAVLLSSGCLLLSWRNPHDTVERTVKKPLQPRFQHRRLNHVLPDRIDRLNSHRKRHFSQQTTSKAKLNFYCFNSKFQTPADSIQLNIDQLQNTRIKTKFLSSIYSKR